MLLNIVAVCLSGLALVIAGLSARYTRQQARWTEVQADEARQVRMITEAQRREDLRPEFAVVLQPLNSGPDEERVMRLTLKLTGPAALESLDAITVEVRDDRPRAALGTGPTQAEVARQIWGPYRFSPGVDQAEPDGRRVSPMPVQRPQGVLPAGESLILQMERTTAPDWYAGGEKAWREEYPRSGPVKLVLTCRAAEMTWAVPLEVVATGWSPRTRVLA